MVLSQNKNQKSPSCLDLGPLHHRDATTTFYEVQKISLCEENKSENVTRRCRNYLGENPVIIPLQ